MIGLLMVPISSLVTNIKNISTKILVNLEFFLNKIVITFKQTYFMNEEEFIGDFSPVISTKNF